MNSSGNGRLIALVTGGNRGIGKEIVLQLARTGRVNVVLTSRDESQGKQVCDKINKEVGEERVIPAQLNVTEEESVKKLAEFMKSRYPSGFDILINNAGYATKGPTVNEQIARDTIGTNYYGVARVCKHLVPLLRQNGRVINVSSGVGHITNVPSEALRNKFMADDLTREQLDSLMEQFISDVRNGVHKDKGWPDSTYQVSKVGLNALTRIMNREFKDDSRNLKLFAVCPGWCRTDMGGPRAPRSAEEGAVTPTWLSLAPLDEIGTGLFFRDNAEIPW